VELGIERPPEARAPALRPAVLVNEDVGLERAETLLAHLTADRFDAIEVGDRWLVPVGMVDAPRGAVRPVEPDAVALLAAEQLVARHAEPLGLGVEQRVLDRRPAHRETRGTLRGGYARAGSRPPHAWRRRARARPPSRRATNTPRFTPSSRRCLRRS